MWSSTANEHAFVNGCNARDRTQASGPAAPPGTPWPAKSMLILVTEWPRVVPSTGEPLTSFRKLLSLAAAAQKSTSTGGGRIDHWIGLL